MQAPLRVAKEVLDRLSCPVCRSRLKLGDDALACVGPECRRVFPVVDGVPVLINEAGSLFSIEDFVQHRDTTFAAVSRMKRMVLGLMPSLQRNIVAKANYSEFARLLLDRGPKPIVLVLGGSRAGQGMEGFLSLRCVEFVETDVAFGPRTDLICDAHDIPFDEGTFEGVVAQAILEHVVDPYRCVAEIHRVLKPDGIVYAETAFMQQVHEGRYDFTRFTHLGHRRLFRSFEEISSGPACGPGMALAWSWRDFLRTFVESRLLRQAIMLLVSLTAWWLKYADYFLVSKRGAYDCAAGYYFMGRRSDKVMPDREVIEGYRGLVGIRS